MFIQGGGVTKHEKVRVYIDLIVGDLSSIENSYPQTSELFAAFSKHYQGTSNFGFAEIDKDDRLKIALSKTKEGGLLFDKVSRSIPIIAVSNHIIGDPDNTSHVKIFKLSDLENDPLHILNKIQKAVSVDDSFLDGIERLNKILSIHPGFFGISINLNQFVENWIARKRNEIQCGKIP